MPVHEKHNMLHSSIDKIRWKQAIGEKRVLAWFAITVAYLIGMVIFLNHFLPFINRRRGIALKDPLLKFLPPVDLSAWIFSIIYLSILVTFLYLLNKPGLLLKVLIALAIVYSLRILTLYFVPLDPPVGCIPLADPFILHFAYGGILITKDLFFSGHTACMLILVLAVQKSPLKVFLLATLTTIMIMLLYQHAHYTIDIAGALVLTPLCWKCSRIICFRIFAPAGARMATKSQPA